MGYTTEFKGEFKVDKEVDQATYELLRGLAKTRRVKRAGLPEKYGVDGEFYYNPEEFDSSRQQHDEDEGTVVDSNTPPSTQPELWLQWEIQEDRQTIKWDDGEKFYGYVEWIKYIINSILKPKGYILNGEVEYQGEEFDDRGVVVVKNNKVTDNKYDFSKSTIVECPECEHKFEV